MLIKDAIYRELAFGLCGAGGALEGTVAEDHVALDERLEPDSERAQDDYPWLLFRRVTEPQDNNGLVRIDRIEFEAVGLQANATKGDDLLETIKDALSDHFHRKRKTIGKFDAEGNADPGGGLLVTCIREDNTEQFDDALNEKSHVGTYKFAYIVS